MQDQHELFLGSPAWRTKIISRTKDFETLFKGFKKMRAVSYVTSPDLLLDFMERQGYSEVEIVVGDSLTESYRQQLAQKGIEVTERLAAMVERGTIRIWVPDRVIHTKLYILEGSTNIRVILSSANLTEAARRVKQINYAWYLDHAPSYPWVQQVIKDYEEHRNRCSLFMGDLIELFRDHSETPRLEQVEAWLKGTAAREADIEIRQAFEEISAQALASANTQDKAIVTLHLPETSLARKQIERSLVHLKPSSVPNGIRLNGPAFLRYVQETHGFPIMRVDRDRGAVMLGLNGSCVTLTSPVQDQTSLNAALQNIEDYIHTVDSGQSSDPKFAKTSMFEALLYVFFAPFASEYTKTKRQAFGSLDTRGPRFLYIYGPSQNGKSTFLKFALKLLTGQYIQPLSGDHFTKTKLQEAASYGTVFPLIFDDVASLQSTSNIQEALKSYWEIWWRDGLVQPQIIVSSNMGSLKEWAKSRVKRVDFDMHFAPNERTKQKLASIFAKENLIFRWFSHLYLERLVTIDSPSDDELSIAREVMKDLYGKSGRVIPDFFPTQPLDKLYDPGRRAWKDLLMLKKARMEYAGDRALVHFSDDIQSYEIRAYEAYLPQTVKYQRKGNTLIIETPNEFTMWLEAKAFRPYGLLDRLKAIFYR